MIRKNIYKWHRTISLIIALPVLLWAISGFLHPVMTNIRPKVATQVYNTAALDTNKIIVPVKEALQQNNINTIHNLRIVQMMGNYFYQVQLPQQKTLQYISTQNGKLLKNGDALYARYLARHFLKEEDKGEKQSDKTLFASVDKQPVIAVSEQVKEEQEEVPDCCLNATMAVMKDSRDAKIISVESIDHFTDEYKNINRLLPVYKVSFEREDGIRIYVETGQDRFSFAMDNNRAVFDKFFMLFHTLGWLDVLGDFKHVVETSIMMLAFSTTLMGLYIFFSTKGKKVKGNTVSKARWNHRYTSVVASLFTLMFTFSGGYHAWEKLKPDTRDEFFVENKIAVDDLKLDITNLQELIGKAELIRNISLVKMNNDVYWQVYHKNRNASAARPKKQAGDFVKAMETPVPTTLYVSNHNYELLPDGEKLYAGYLAAQFSTNKKEEIKSVSPITKFADEYGFVNKRLPVWKVQYASNNNERYYVETSTSKLSVRVDDKDLYEGYSFAMLHKHHFMDWGGKTVRDISTMFWALMQVAMVTVGLVLYFKFKNNRKLKS